MSNQINSGRSFFEDKDKEKNDKGDSKKCDERRLEHFASNKPVCVTGNDCDERTFHSRFITVFSPAANGPKREQPRCAADGVNEHVQPRRHRGWDKQLVEFIAGRVRA